MTEARGIPVGAVTAAANRNDCTLCRATIESVALDRPAPTSEQLQGVCLDKAYDSADIRATLHEFAFTAHIRRRGEEIRELRREDGERPRRWVVERIHSWINRYRGLLIRWSKKAENHDALLAFCLSLITWQQAGVMKGMRAAL